MLGQAEKYMKVMTGFGSAAKRIQVRLGGLHCFSTYVALSVLSYPLLVTLYRPSSFYHPFFYPSSFFIPSPSFCIFATSPYFPDNFPSSLPSPPSRSPSPLSFLPLVTRR